MANRFSIASITLAYNAAQVLPRQVDALLRQGSQLDEVIVVNNGSTDNTGALVSRDYPQVSIVNLPENIGTGGGYAAGLTYAAKEKKYDWVWLLDQDSVPDVDSLEKLLNGLASYEGLGEDIGVLAPRSRNARTKLSYPGFIWRNGFVRPSLDSLDQPLCFIDAIISSGSLIRREVIEQVGLPRSDFFIDFVDFEYCIRIRRHGYKIAVVRDSHLDHTIGDPRVTKFFGYSKAWNDHEPWREYYMSRNEVFTIWDYYPDWRSKLSVLRRLFRHAAGILVFGKRKISCLSMMFRGFWDGRAGRLGIRFIPDVNNRAGFRPVDPVFIEKSEPI